MLERVKGVHADLVFQGGAKVDFLICSSHRHYYRTRMLFRLETNFSLGFPTRTTLSGLKVADFSPRRPPSQKEGGSTIKKH